MQIFGVDVLRHQTRKTAPLYALAILNTETDEVRKHSVTKFKLVRLINKLRPEIVATDNVYELGESKKELLAFLRAIPPETKLVQVTNGGSLKSIARKYGIRVNALDPMSEAEACATLAALGVGYELSIFEDRTLIKVSRARSLGKGGWSQKRYSRRVHGAVMRKAREIEETLLRSGLRFKKEERIGIGGYARCVFIVEAPRAAIPIKSGKYGDVQVKISCVEREKIKFTKLGRKYTIVGIDPGTTIGVAVLDLDGNLLWLHSSKNYLLSDIILKISSLGKPLIVASDVTPAPETVKRIKSTFSSLLYEVDEPLSVEEKIMLTKGFNCANDHERDALVACLQAFKKFKNKFAKIERKAPTGVDVDEVKALVVRGTSIRSAIEKISSKAESTTDEKTEEKQADKPEMRKDEKIRSLKEELREKEEQIKRLREFISELKDKLKEKDEKISRLEERLRLMRFELDERVRKDERIRILESMITALRAELERERREKEELKEMLKGRQGAKTPDFDEKSERLVKVAKSFSKHAIAEVEARYGLESGDVILFEDSSGGGANTAELLAKRGVRAVIFNGEPSHFAADKFLELGVPFFSADEIKVRRSGDFAFVSRYELNEKIREWMEERKRILRRKGVVVFV
ncbi:MAG TPA: DUF460 domain-containing protein [Methanomicrobia archaeon]|nr:DUF460 domain-containing protein [Methanomicrobia archaeon]HEX59606.1 DUF460 domain-containing protein [Methanomicrobia archaeon]